MRTSLKRMARIPFKTYCKILALGADVPAAQARFVLGIGGTTVDQCARRIRAQFRKHEIDEDQYRYRMDVLDDTVVLFKAGYRCRTVECDLVGGWQTIGLHCHKRVDHKAIDFSSTSTMAY